MRYLIFICTLILIFSSCFDAKKQKLIIGEWKGVEWLVDGSSAGFSADQAVFTFGDDKRYSFQYGDNVEKGQYFYSSKQLNTTPDGGIRMMVRVPKLEEDTMVFIMNRGGQSEQLTLVRIN